VQQAIDGEGALETHKRELEAVLQKAKELGGTTGVLSGIDEIAEANRRLERLKQESLSLRFLQDEMDKGAWLNANVRCGDYGNYQDRSEINTTALSNAVISCQRNKMETKEGRQWFAVAQVLVPLRFALASAVKQVELSSWKSVVAALEGTTSIPKHAGEILERYREELDAAKRELAYLESAQAIRESLQKSTASRDESGLELYLMKASDLNMQEDYFTEVRQAKSLLTKINNFKVKLKVALFKLTRSLLWAAVQEAESFQYDSVEVQRCRRMYELLTSLKAAVKGFRELEIQKLLEECAKEGLDEQSDAISSAKNMLVQLKVVRDEVQRTVDTAEAAAKQSGVTDVHLQSMKEALVSANKVGGLSHCEEVKSAKAWIELVEQERRLVMQLTTAVETGGWINFSIRSGDFSKYQSHTLIEIKSLDAAIQASADLNPKTVEGRVQHGLAKVVLELRKLLIEALPQAVTELDPWKKIETLLNEAGKTLTVKQLSHIELTVARKEVEYRVEILQVLKEVSSAVSDRQTELLIELLQKASALNIQEQFFSVIKDARALLTQLQNCRAQLVQGVDSSDEKSLTEALEEAAKLRYDGAEVKRGTNVRDALVNLGKAVASYSMHDIEAALQTVRVWLLVWSSCLLFPVSYYFLICFPLSFFCSS
jgi:hypothetical protein